MHLAPIETRNGHALIWLAACILSAWPIAAASADEPESNAVVFASANEAIETGEGHEPLELASEFLNDDVPDSDEANDVASEDVVAHQASLKTSAANVGNVYRRVPRSGQSSAGKRWSLLVSQTADYVTNLALPNAITPNNASIRQDDWQFQTLMNGQYKIAGDTKRNLTTGYTFYQSIHPAVKQIDLMSHTVLTRYTHAFSTKVIGALDYEYSYFLLQGVPFVSRNRIGGKLLMSPTTRGDWQLGYDLSSNDFRIDPNQTAIANSVRLERIQYLTQDRNNYLTFGYAIGRNTAAISNWSYLVNNFFAGARWKWGSQKKNEALLLGSYGRYNFDNVDLLDGVVRWDNIWTASGRVSRNINDRFAVFAQYVYYNSASNVVRQIYDSSLSSMGAQMVW